MINAHKSTDTIRSIFLIGKALNQRKDSTNGKFYGIIYRNTKASFSVSFRTKAPPCSFEGEDAY
jgi:hypothetical protein